MTMKDLNSRYKPYSEIPACCTVCKNLMISGSGDEDPITTCQKDLRFPVVKQSCKGQDLFLSNDQIKSKTGSELERRVKEARCEIDKYPKWVKESMTWQGNGDRSGQDDFKSYGNY